MKYPASPIVDCTDSLAGVAFPDPYRWLEENNNTVREWQRTQNGVTGQYIEAIPQFESTKTLADRFLSPRSASLPRFAANRWFRTEVREGSIQSVVLVSQEPASGGAILFDPMQYNPDRPPFISWISPAPDGRTLALGLCSDGSENNVICLVDVISGEILPDSPPQTLMDNWTGGAHWLPDSSGFFFSALDGTQQYSQQVFLHRRRPSPSTEQVNIPWAEAGKDYRMVVIAADGGQAIAFERSKNPIPVAVAEIGPGTMVFKPFVTSFKGTLAGHVVRGRFFGITDDNAPRGRLVAIPLDTLDASDPEKWEVLVPESSSVLRTVHPIGDLLYVHELVDTYSHVRIIDLHGREVGTVPLPGLGAVNDLFFPLTELTYNTGADAFIYSFSSLLQSPGIYRHRSGADTSECLRTPAIILENAIVEDAWATSKDGTRIPYHLVRRIDTFPTQSHPTLILGYGGFNMAMLPKFPGAAAAFVEMGGQFVHAHLRGGSEFGLEWWSGGRQKNKQNCYDDLYAIAEQLIEQGRTSPASLAVTGRSNGGLMAGVAVTQRPDLWAAAIPCVPFLDCIGGCRDPYGRHAVATELADISDPQDIRRLASVSPCHLVRPGVNYPAIYIDAGDTDPRCPAWHARKFAAALQNATSGSAPILLRVWENAGHGFATDRNTTLLEYAEWLTFAALHTGLIGDAVNSKG